MSSCFFLGSPGRHGEKGEKGLPGLSGIPGLKGEPGRKDIKYYMLLKVLFISKQYLKEIT